MENIDTREVETAKAVDQMQRYGKRHNELRQLLAPTDPRSWHSDCENARYGRVRHRKIFSPKNLSATMFNVPATRLIDRTTLSESISQVVVVVERSYQSDGMVLISGYANDTSSIPVMIDIKFSSFTEWVITLVDHINTLRISTSFKESQFFLVGCDFDDHACVDMIQKNLLKHVTSDLKVMFFPWNDKTHDELEGACYFKYLIDEEQLQFDMASFNTNEDLRMAVLQQASRYGIADGNYITARPVCLFDTSLTTGHDDAIRPFLKMFYIFRKALDLEPEKAHTKAYTLWLEKQIAFSQSAFNI